MTDAGLAGCCLGASVIGKVGPWLSSLGRRRDADE